MFKLTIEEKEELENKIKELKAEIERIEFVLKMNERATDNNNVYENKNNSQNIGPLELTGSPFKCCENCSNNTKNGGSGICCCDLPYHEMFKW